MVIKVGIDQGVDLKALRRVQDQGLIELRQANRLEQTWEHFQVTQQKKGFMLNHSMLGGPDVLADDKVREVENILGGLRGHEADVGHIYACYLNECEYFVTNDVTEFAKRGRREKLERLLRVKIRTMQEFIQEVAP
jgi:hypothetical protein